MFEIFPIPLCCFGSITTDRTDARFSLSFIVLFLRVFFATGGVLGRLLVDRLEVERFWGGGGGGEGGLLTGDFLRADDVRRRVRRGGDLEGDLCRLSALISLRKADNSALDSNCLSQSLFLYVSSASVWAFNAFSSLLKLFLLRLLDAAYPGDRGPDDEDEEEDDESSLEEEAEDEEGEDTSLRGLRFGFWEAITSFWAASASSSAHSIVDSSPSDSASSTLGDGGR